MNLRNRSGLLSIGFSLSLGMLTACGNPARVASSSTASTASTSSAVSLAVSPAVANVTVGKTISFGIKQSGLSNKAVTWSIQEGATGGSISNFGEYTPPSTLGTYHVVATSVADATVTASATVTVTLSAGSFAAVGNMSSARVEDTATLLANGKVLIAGGWDGSKVLGSAEIYDPATRTFTPTGSMVTSRHLHLATLLADGRVLIAGGNGDRPSKSNGSPIFSAEIYDPLAGTFTPTGNLDPVGGSVSSLFFSVGWPPLLPDGRVFVAASNRAQIYDPQSGTFSFTSPYPTTIPGISTVTLLPNNKVLLTDADNGTLLFDPQTGAFVATGAMQAKYAPEFGYIAALLANGRVLFVGYDTISGSDFEIYDSTAGTFSSLPGNLPVHYVVPAARLGDGTVLFAGSGNGSDADVFLPSSNTFVYAGDMISPRYSNTSTALPDNTVLITGGTPAGGTSPSSSAEIYVPR
jgi:hypothetical protein